MALDFVAGCLGGCAGILVGHPLDTVKVHLQTQDQRKPAYRGAFDCFGHIVHKESVRGLYRGMAAPLAGVAAVNAVTFGVYGLASRSLGGDSLRGQFVAGALSGLAQSAICAPLEQLKTRAQLLGVGPLQSAADALRREGPRGLFRGLGATVLRDTPGMGIYFATYEALTRGSSPAPAPTWLVLAAGGTAGAASWLFTYPVDVLKSRLQADGAAGQPRRYSGMADCLRQSVRSDGWSILTRGLGIVVVRAFPTNAACFFTVTLVLRWDQERRRASGHSAGQPANAQEPSSSLVQLQPPRAATAWYRRHLDDVFAWRRSLSRSTACGFLKLEGPATDGRGQGDAADPNWSRPQYESVHRLFLHTADFTEASWLGSAEFLTPPEGDATWESAAGPENDEVPTTGADNLWEGGGSEMVQSPLGTASSAEIPTPVHKLGPKSDDVQIMGSPASGLVRKPDAVRHISRDDANRSSVAPQADSFQGYIVPPAELWLYQGGGNHLEQRKLAAARPDKSRSSND